jgi:hypothetical protein
MALFRASLRTFSRSKGDSATAAAAYRAGVDLADDRLGVTHRFSRRKGVESFKVFAPLGAPDWSTDISKLWNAAEAAETRKNSRVARELVVSLPHELSSVQRTELAEGISKTMVERYGLAAMLAVHAPDAKGDQRNHHCHILLSTRELTSMGFGAKVRTLDDRVQGPLEVEFLREMVEERTNAALAAANVGERVDRRCLEVRAKAAEEAGDFDGAAKLTREPMLVVGRAATAAARRGIPQERAKANASILADHQQDLAIYLARVRAQGRLMPPASDRSLAPRHGRVPFPNAATTTTRGRAIPRATGAGAKLLNEQAAALEESARLSKKLGRDYIESILRDVRASQRWLDAYLALMQREHERDLWLQRCALDRELEGLLRQSVEARMDMRALRMQDTERRSEHKKAVARREAEQREVESTEGAKVPVWNVALRRRWKAKHVAQGARLRQAVLDEQHTREKSSGAALAERRAKADAIKSKIARAEDAIRLRVADQPTQGMPPRMTEEPTNSSRRPRLQ